MDLELLSEDFQKDARNRQFEERLKQLRAAPVDQRFIDEFSLDINEITLNDMNGETGPRSMEKYFFRTRPRPTIAEVQIRINTRPELSYVWGKIRLGTYFPQKGYTEEKRNEMMLIRSEKLPDNHQFIYGQWYTVTSFNDIIKYTPLKRVE